MKTLLESILNSSSAGIQSEIAEIQKWLNDTHNSDSYKILKDDNGVPVVKFKNGHLIIYAKEIYICPDYLKNDKWPWPDLVILDSEDKNKYGEINISWLKKDNLKDIPDCGTINIDRSSNIKNIDALPKHCDTLTSYTIKPYNLSLVGHIKNLKLKKLFINGFMTQLTDIKGCSAEHFIFSRYNINNFEPGKNGYFSKEASEMIDTFIKSNKTSLENIEFVMDNWMRIDNRFCTLEYDETEKLWKIAKMTERKHYEKNKNITRVNIR